MKGFPRSVFAASAERVEVGLQLYSVREDMKSDPKGSLKKIAGMGYPESDEKVGILIP